MKLFFRKFISVLLVLWLPLLSGNALATSITMQFKGSDCDSALNGKSKTYSSQIVSKMHHRHADFLSPQDHLLEHKQVNKECGKCVLACCGYVPASVVTVTKMKLPAVKLEPADAQFQSITSIPLDPPPLVRV